ncbi:MAG: 50S ribosomal protein L17 [Bacteroidales bacterium]|nr:50S ribosomal protein L17 [Bacteroidales bacterium]
MRHRNKINQLSRKSAHRNAMMSNMAVSLIMHKRITTTVPKAKVLKTFIEPLITQAKEDTTHNRRVVFSKLQDKKAVAELFREVSVKVGDRPGGYTRILRTGIRLGDNAEMCIIELVDYNENMLTEDTARKKTARRSRRRSSGSKATTERKEETMLNETTTEKEVVEETIVEESVTEQETTEEIAEETTVEETQTEETDETSEENTETEDK